MWSLAGRPARAWRTDPQLRGIEVMSAVRPAALGATRTCPHCKATVLASASICPGCQHHLRFNASDARPAAVGVPALQIEVTVRVPTGAETCEYCVVLSIGDGHS